MGLSPEDHGRETTVVQRSPSEVIAQIADCDALAIPAHVNSSRGLFTEMKGRSRTLVIQHSSLHAVEATDNLDPEKRSNRRRAIDFLDGTDPEYKRKLAVIQSSDNPALAGKSGHSVEGIGIRVTYFKMERVDLQSLRNCFDDPDVRIRIELAEPIVFPRIETISILGGFLDGCTITFHEGLTSVIGAKGSGKSLLVELLRFVLDQCSANEGVADDHRSKLEQCLKTYGTVEVTLVLETGRRIAVKRHYDPEENNPQEDASVDVTRVFPVLFLSQNEIIRIAEDENEQLAFIDRFFDFKAHTEAIDQFERELKGLDKQLAATLRAFIETEGLKSENRPNQR